MVAEGYGKVLGRPGLPLVDRELCIVAMLAVLQAPRQLYSHLRGALHAGATESDVRFALTQAEAFVASPEARRQARETWDGVLARRAQPKEAAR
jgi:4-carboxymuconolactone decarboxylase